MQYKHYNYVLGSTSEKKMATKTLTRATTLAFIADSISVFHLKTSRFLKKLHLNSKSGNYKSKGLHEYER